MHYKQLQKTVIKLNRFTLLEMILSVAIFAMIMLTIGTGMFSIQQTWNRMTKKDDMLKTYQTLDRVLDTAFRNTVLFTWPNDKFQKKSVFLGNTDECIIAYIHRISRPSDGGIRFLKLYVDDRSLIAEFRKYPILHWDENHQKMSKEILAKNIKNVNFLYAKRENDEIVWIDDWDEENNQSIPLAIQITIEWENGAKEQWLRRTAGSGRFESYGKKITGNEI